MTIATNSDLAGKTALVTGATSGIGRAAAIQLAAQGADVIVAGRNPERGGQVVEEIELAGGHARFVAADLSTEAGISSLAAEAGPVDVLVNTLVRRVRSDTGAHIRWVRRDVRWQR